MPDLKNKTILILSPQAWGKMFVSKHHYAIELAKRGNRIYFLNPPNQDGINATESIEIKPSGIHSDLFLIEHKLFFPYQLKFKFLPVFQWLMQFHIKRLLKKIGKPIDIVWSFDLGHLYPFNFFDKNSYKIFHPVDEPLTVPAILAAKGADVVFSVTNEILSKYEQYNVPRYFINHGVTSDFLTGVITEKINQPVLIGFSGNLLRNDIDREVLLQIVEENQQCIFNFWGSYTTEQSNIGGIADDLTVQFINKLQTMHNVVLHGVVPSRELAESINRMDAFLICYDVLRDQSKGTNYHKVMEYLATGKVIISNNISTYNNRSDLVQMVVERDTNVKLPLLFSNIISNLAIHITKDLSLVRREFASLNTYNNQIERIERLIYEE
jgi:hypothetical protein